MSIIIFSRPVQTGKTTELQRYIDLISPRKKVAGVLMPDINGKRYLQDISTKELFKIECDDTNSDSRQLIKVGRFNFYQDVFDKANGIIKGSVSLCDVMIIDEVGKLELEKTGLYNSICAVIEENSFRNSKDLVLVVRDSLYDLVIDKFSLYSCTTKMGTLL
jgi:nucleoside-triphosphatase THEP1